MMDDKTRADHAARLLSDQVLLAALDAMERDLIDGWESTPVRDKEGKEEFWRLYKTAKKFRGILSGYVEGGKMARVHDPLAERVARKLGF